MLMLVYLFHRRSRQEDCYQDAEAHVCRKTKDEQGRKKIALDHHHMHVLYYNNKLSGSDKGVGVVFLMAV